MIAISKTTTLEVALKTGSTGAHKIGQQTQLTGKRIKHLIQIKQGKSPNGLTVKNYPALLVLKDAGQGVILDHLPTSMLVEDRQEVVQLHLKQEVAWEKSDVIITDPSQIAEGDCLLFTVIFE